MARRKRASMREGPLADLFRSTAAPDDPPEAPTPPPRREDHTRVMRDEPAASEPEAREEPAAQEVFDVEESEPEREDVRAYRAEEEPAAADVPDRKDRLSKI